MKKTVWILVAIPVVIMLAACSSSRGAGNSAVSRGLSFADTVAWDGEYDVIVVGFGGAGATAAIHAARAGARVLLTEKAPEGQEGGNTRYCGQTVAAVVNREDALAYYAAMSGDREISEPVVNTFVNGLLTIIDTVKKDFGAEQIYEFKDGENWVSPEYPEFPGSKSVHTFRITPGGSDGALWRLIRKNVTDLSDKIDIWYEAPGRHLIQDPYSKTILGVRIEKQGKPVNIRAINGVVLATGGFENNPDMRQDYLGLPKAAVLGTLYNTGDGLKMAMEAGADLWHMNVYEGAIGYGGGTSLVVPGNVQGIFFMLAGPNDNKSHLLVNGNGDRFLDETYFPRHGHIYINDTWHNPVFSEKMYIIFDQGQKNAFDTAGTIPERYRSQIIQAASLDALAQGLKLPNLVQTVNTFNGYARSGNDQAFHRTAASMAPLSGNAYYALELMPDMLNTQGGPRRNEKAEVLNTEGNPIPHLYSAGELGGFASHMYQGGSNVAECIIFGKIAGINAAASKNTVPFPIPGRVNSNIVYTPGSTADTKAGQSYTTGANEYIGEGTGMGGIVTIKVAMNGSRIASVEILNHNETPGISDGALATLPGAIVEANSADVDGVSGATLTSNALKAAVKDALSKVK
jgi:succinate dehydrogenase/fumarate reductase flavoprotein subunit/uncharacterized protein with FMN-binding domain